MLPRRVDHISQKVVEVRNTSTLVVEKNPDRILLLVVNDSNVDMYISVNEPAELHKGFLLEPKKCFECRNMIIWQMFAIHNSILPKKLLVIEGT